MQTNCYICGREFKAKPSDKRKTPNLCCSHACGYEKRRRRHPVEERFWAKADKRGPTECWLWKASTHGYNPPYGHFHYGKENVAHRVSWILMHGPIPEGMQVCHNCPTGDNPLCVNPNHLWLGDQSQNILDAVAKGRHKAPRGEQHPLAKYTEVFVRELRARHKAGDGPIALAKAYGIPIHSIRSLLYNGLWKHVV